MSRWVRMTEQWMGWSPGAGRWDMHHHLSEFVLNLCPWKVERDDYQSGTPPVLPPSSYCFSNSDPFLKTWLMLHLVRNLFWYFYAQGFVAKPCSPGALIAFIRLVLQEIFVPDNNLKRGGRDYLLCMFVLPAHKQTSWKFSIRVWEDQNWVLSTYSINIQWTPTMWKYKQEENQIPSAWHFFSPKTHQLMKGWW